MMEMKEVSSEIFSTLIECGVAEKFREMMRLRAEIAMRALPSVPDEKRQISEGEILICLELADGVKDALAASEAQAKVDEAMRIRQRLNMPDDILPTESLE